MIRHTKIAEVTVDCTACGLFSVLYLVIILETVIGMPDDVTVRSRPNTVSAIWYTPIPSEPIVLER